MNATQTTQARIEALTARAQAKARELGRWDALHAICDLIAAELPREVFCAWAWYHANDTSETLNDAWRVCGGRGEWSNFCSDAVEHLGTWVKWDLGEGVKYGLSSFEPWTPPAKPLTAAQRRAARPGPLCGCAGHGSWSVSMDPRGPDYRADLATSIEVCENCFDDWADELHMPIMRQPTAH